MFVACVLSFAAAHHGPAAIVQYPSWDSDTAAHMEHILQGNIAWYVAVVPTTSNFSVYITPNHDDIPPPRPYGPWPRPPPREAAVGKPLPRSPLREKLMVKGLPAMLANLQASVHAITWVLLPRKSSIWPTQHV